MTSRGVVDDVQIASVRLRAHALGASIAVVAVGLFAWWGIWNHDWIFDDHPAIETNAALLTGNWREAAFMSWHQPLAGRPFACLSLAVDFAVFGPGPFGPHLGNLLLHLANALLLYALVNRTLRAPALAAAFEPKRAAGLAFAVAVIWVAHPLACDAVAYATQRSTLLFSGLLLLALLATNLATNSSRAGAWRMLGVLAMALAMASKEDAVVGPLLIVLYERAFLLPSWSAMRPRLWYFGAMAATWIVLALCIAAAAPNPSVGYSTTPAVSAWQWLMTQASVIVHYVRLVLWPAPLRGAYDWGVVRALDVRTVLAGLVVSGFVGLAAASWARRPWWGWLGAVFFLLLAPTSTILPIVTEVVAERRVYLPMAALLIGLVIGGERVVARVASGSRVFPALAASCAIVLAIQARSASARYANDHALWTDAYEKRDPESRAFLAAQILSNYGAILQQQGRHDEANACLDQAVQCESPTVTTRARQAVSLQYRGRAAEGLAILRELAREGPDNAERQGVLASYLVSLHSQDTTKHGNDDARLVEAEAALRQALLLNPNQPTHLSLLGYVLRNRGRLAEAEAAYRRATELTTALDEAFFSRAELLDLLGRPDEIAPLFARLLAARPRDVDLLYRLSHHCAVRKDLPAAAEYLEQLLKVDPGHAKAREILEKMKQRIR